MTELEWYRRWSRRARTAWGELLVLWTVKPGDPATEEIQRLRAIMNERYEPPAPATPGDGMRTMRTVRLAGAFMGVAILGVWAWAATRCQ